MEGRKLVFSDSSMLEDGRVGGGWYGEGWIGSSLQGNSHMGVTATGWDREIVGIKEVDKNFERGERILLLVDSKVAISAVKKTGRTGKARTRCCGYGDLLCCFRTALIHRDLLRSYI